MRNLVAIFCLIFISFSASADFTPGSIIRVLNNARVKEDLQGTSLVSIRSAKNSQGSIIDDIVLCGVSIGQDENLHPATTYPTIKVDAKFAFTGGESGEIEVYSSTKVHPLCR